MDELLSAIDEATSIELTKGLRQAFVMFMPDVEDGEVVCVAWFNVWTWNPDGTGQFQRVTDDAGPVGMKHKRSRVFAAVKQYLIDGSVPGF